MNPTGNWCPYGVLQMRSAFPVDPETVRQVEPKRKAYVADCPKCGRPNVPVVREGDDWVFSGHTTSNIQNQYTGERTRPWDRR